MQWYCDLARHWSFPRRPRSLATSATIIPTAFPSAVQLSMAKNYVHARDQPVGRPRRSHDQDASAELLELVPSSAPCFRNEEHESSVGEEEFDAERYRPGDLPVVLDLSGGNRILITSTLRLGLPRCQATDRGYRSPLFGLPQKRDVKTRGAGQWRSAPKHGRLTRCQHNVSEQGVFTTTSVSQVVERF